MNNNSLSPLQELNIENYDSTLLSKKNKKVVSRQASFLYQAIEQSQKNFPPHDFKKRKISNMGVVEKGDAKDKFLKIVEKKDEKENHIPTDAIIKNEDSDIENEDSENTLEVIEEVEKLPNLKKTISEKLIHNVECASLHMLQQRDNEHCLTLFNQTLNETTVPDSISLFAQVSTHPLKTGYIKGHVDRPLNTEKKTLLTGPQSNIAIDVGMSNCQGVRFTMEDESLAEHATFYIQGKEHFFDIFGVLDGHGGNDVAVWVKKNIVKYFCEHLEKNNSEGLTDEGIFKSFKNAVIMLGKDYTEKNRPGTVLNMIVLLNKKIWVINLGDSRTLLIDEKGKTVQGSEDMKPNVPRYSNKIEKNGGNIINGRVNGILSVARAIGDNFMGDIISSHSKIAFYEFDQFKKGTVLSVCDGVCDVISGLSLGKFVGGLKEKGIVSAQEISQWITYAAIKAGSSDNVSVVAANLPENPGY